jgi:hypothetical protein
MNVTYTIAEANDEYLVIENEKFEEEIPWYALFYLITDGDQTALVCFRRQHIVKMHIDVVEKLLPANMFIRIHDKYIVGRDHVGKFENNLVEIQPMKFPVDEGYKVVKEDFPWVATPELVKQQAMKDRKIIKKWREN